jgi:hypothetical protein
VAGDRAYVLYVLDMAEIPTYQERQRLGRLGPFERELTARVGRGLQLSVGGRRVRLQPPRATRWPFPPGWSEG